MRVLNRTIEKNKITGNTIHIPIFITQKVDTIGLYEDLATDVTKINSITVTVTGTTDNKLAEVRGFDYNSPYTVGNNGVTEVTADHIKYDIDGIAYVTQLADLRTTFTFTTVRDEYSVNNFVSEDKNLAYTDKVDVQDNVDIERVSVSVIEAVSKIRQITTVMEIENFNNGFYKINNQTI